MSGISVRELTQKDVDEYLASGSPEYDHDRELSWSVEYYSRIGWHVVVQDDGGDVRLWKINLGKTGKEVT